MRKIIYVLFSIFLFCASTSLSIFDGQAWGAADTLLPVADNVNTWAGVTGCSDHYDCVDDPPGSPDDDDTKLSTSAAARSENYQLETATMSGTIDSLQIRVRGYKTGTPANMLVGFVWWDGEGWYWEFEDSIDYTGDYADYSILSIEDESALAWTNAKIDARRWGGHSGAGNMIWSFTITQVFLIVYYAEAVEVGQVIIIH